MKHRPGKRRSGRRIYRRKNIYNLPTEVWVEVFRFAWPWTSRPALGQMVDKIGNRWFGEQLQFYLHEWGKCGLGCLTFEKGRVLKAGALTDLEFPETEMPENIKSFVLIEIKHFDHRVLNFFRQIQPLLTKNVEIYVKNKRERQTEERIANVRTILGHMLPQIDGKIKVTGNCSLVSQLKTLFRDKFKQIPVVDLEFGRTPPDKTIIEAIVQCVQWLTHNNEPKWLELFYDREVTQKIIDSVRKQFTESTEPSTFAVYFFFPDTLPEFCIENSLGEQLVGRGTGWHFEVLRHQTNAGDELRVWVKNTSWSHNQITFDNPTIGQIDNIAADNEEDDNDQPCSSSS